MANELFKTHLLNSDGKEKAKEIAEAFSNLLAELETKCGTETREMKIVRTHLQDACFYSKRALSMKVEYQRS